MSADTNRERDGAREVFERLGEVYLFRGHERWMEHATRLNDYYIAGGRQWKADDREFVEGEGRPCYEVDIVKPRVNTATGYQISNRVDISFVARGGSADEKSAKLVSKVVRQVLDNANWRHIETDTFLDGLIQQRGFIDIRMDYEHSDLGVPLLRSVDPLDAIPDPDGKTVDPDSWADYHETRWLTETEIEHQYGHTAAKAVKANSEVFCNAEDFGDEEGIERSGFGSQLPGMYRRGRGWVGREGPWRRYRVVERQTNEYVNTLVARWPTGDLHIVEGRDREYIGWLLEQGIPVFKRRMRRVRWKVAAPEVMIYDSLSPYNHITVVPFFPYFRRGQTIGMVDSLMSVQDMLNKFTSQYGHVVNGSANSGWQGEEKSLSNMTDEELAEKGASTGLILLRKAGKPELKKIEPNQMPSGLEKMVEFAYTNAPLVSGVNDAMQGIAQGDESGIAVQSRQFAAQQGLAVALDNLSRSRKLVAMRTLECVQKFMGAERVMRIAEDDAFGVKRQTPYTLNERSADGSILNDLTIGQYDLILNEQPAQVTFDNSQFEQMKSMRVDMAIPISDARVVRASNLTDKSEIADELQQAEQNKQADPMAEAEAAHKRAQAKKAEAEAVGKSIEAQFSAVKTAREIVLTPQIAQLADALLKSGGFVDQDAAPIVPTVPEGTPAVPMEPESTNPLTPSNPEAGLNTGLTSTESTP